MVVKMIFGDYLEGSLCKPLNSLIILDLKTIKHSTYDKEILCSSHIPWHPHLTLGFRSTQYVRLHALLYWSLEIALFIRITEVNGIIRKMLPGTHVSQIGMSAFESQLTSWF